MKELNKALFFNLLDQITFTNGAAKFTDQQKEDQFNRVIGAPCLSCGKYNPDRIAIETNNSGILFYRFCSEHNLTDDDIERLKSSEWLCNGRINLLETAF